ncbi:MAG: organomercurial lyase [Halobacteriota archaeon]
MDPDDCDCGDPEATTGGSTAAEDRWLDGDDPLHEPLPATMQVALGDLVGRVRVETLADWADDLGDRLENGRLSIDDLCHTDADTGHRGTVDGDRYDFRCFFDAVILAALVDEPVGIETTNPRGSTVTARAVGTDAVAVEPETAAFSFGVDPAVAAQAEAADGLGVGYRAICPYVHAFSTRAEYFAWAVVQPVPTVGLPMASASAFAEVLTD